MLEGGKGEGGRGSGVGMLGKDRTYFIQSAMECFQLHGGNNLGMKGKNVNCPIKIGERYKWCYVGSGLEIAGRERGRGEGKGEGKNVYCPIKIGERYKWCYVTSGLENTRRGYFSPALKYIMKERKKERKKERNKKSEDDIGKHN